MKKLLYPIVFLFVLLMAACGGQQVRKDWSGTRDRAEKAQQELDEQESLDSDQGRY